MTRTISVDETLSLQTILALARNGDEIVLEENGEPLVKVLPVAKSQSQKPRAAEIGVFGVSELSDNELTLAAENLFLALDREEAEAEAQAK